jgi:hypothetical protein
MSGQYSLILATDYNIIQSKVALVLGSGTGNTGYGQTVASSQVIGKTTATVSQWANLRTDLLKARQHQTGVDLSSSLVTPSKGTPITEADRAAYDAMANDATDPANRLIKPPVSQATRQNLVPTTQINSAWNGLLTQTITVTFPDPESARYFFNSGSQIEFSASRTGGSNTVKNNTWSTMFATMQVIAFNHNSTTTNGTGVPSTNIGWYQLTHDNQLIFAKYAPSGAYADNKYYISARSPVPTQVIFTIKYQDDSLGTFDENVDGILSSIVQVYRASGDNVSVPVPPAIASNIG